MAMLIMMNKSYNDDGALEDVVNYVASGGYGYYGGYGIDPRHAAEQMRLVKNFGEKTAEEESVISSCHLIDQSQLVMKEPCRLVLISVNTIPTISQSMGCTQIQITSIYILQSILSPSKMERCMPKGYLTGTG